jgi:hypothetical protein
MNISPTNRAACIALAAALTGFDASAQQLILNGDFETGLAGWTVTDQAGGSGTWTAGDASGIGPLSASATVGPHGGLSYALSDQGGPGAHALTQSFVVPPSATGVSLSFSMFVSDWSATGGVINPIGLDSTGPANQHARVDLLTGTASPFSTAPADVVINFYLGVDAGTPPRPYKDYAFDLTGIVTAGGTYQIRFAEVDNQLFLNMGVDDVSIAAVAEPAGEALAAALALTGLAGIVGWRRLRR